MCFNIIGPFSGYELILPGGPRLPFYAHCILIPVKRKVGAWVFDPCARFYLGGHPEAEAFRVLWEDQSARTPVSKALDEDQSAPSGRRE